MFKAIQDSRGFHAVDFEFQVLDSLSLKLGIRIAIVTGISDSCLRILKPRNLDLITQISRIPNFNSQRFPWFRIPKAKFPGFRIPQAKVSRIPDSKSKDFPNSGFHKQKFPGFPYIGRSMRRNRIEFSPINVITVTKKRLIILITLHMLKNYWMRFLWYPE